jgi:uncharacterized protein YecT (DUF1311 family)
MQKLIVSLVLVFLPISGYALSRQYEQCANAVIGASADDCGIADEYARLYEKMEVVYKAAVKSKPELLKNQSKWLKKLKKDCPEVLGTTSSYRLRLQCLAEETEARISELENDNVNTFAVNTFENGSNERKLVMDSLRIPVQKELTVPVQFVVSVLNVVGDYVFVMGVPQQKSGKPIDYRRTIHKYAYEEGAFDDGITALLKRDGRTWRVLTYNIGATDVSFGCWWKEYKVPKELFTVALDEC